MSKSGKSVTAEGDFVKKKSSETSKNSNQFCERILNLTSFTEMTKCYTIVLETAPGRNFEPDYVF